MFAQHHSKLVFLFAALLVCVTSWHYVACVRQTPKGWRFSGLTYNLRDQNTYLTWMAQARAGKFFFDNLYTGEKEQPGYCNILWWALGTFSRITGLSLISVYHGSRVVFIFVFLLLLDRFIGYFLADERERWCAFLLISLGTGFGWLLVLFSPLMKSVLSCADLWIPEAFAFLSMLWFPHFVFSLILQVSIYWLFLAACERDRASWAIGAGALALLLGFTHTYHLPTVYVVVTMFALLNTEMRWQSLKYAVLIVGLSLPALIYFTAITRICPSMAAWKQQNICRSPAIWWYVAGFGAIALLPLLFPRQLTKLADKSPRNLFLLTWLLCNVALLYTYPLLPFERRLVQGLQIPLTLLSVQILFRVIRQVPRFATLQTRRALLIGALVAFSMPTSLFHLTVTSFRVLPPRSPEYLSPDELATIAYLRRNASADAVILAPEQQGMWLPLMTKRRVFVGHPGLTADYRCKSRLVQRFFAGKMSAQELRQLLQAHSVNFIYWQRREDIHLPDSPLWVRVFHSSQMDIYRIARRTQKVTWSNAITTRMMNSSSVAPLSN